MIKTKTKQTQRNIIMVIGAIVVVIILVYAYLEFTTKEPIEQHLLKIKEDTEIRMPDTEGAIDINFNFP